MRKVVLFGILFAAANFMAIWGHIILFQSSWPFSSWVSFSLHVVGLLYFPYKKVFLTNK